MMSTTVAKKSQNGTAISNPRDFRDSVAKIATFMLSEWAGEQRAKDSIGRVTVALSAAAASAKDPSDFYACTPQSVAHVVAISALTGIMPGTGAGALAYVIPRRDRKDDPPKLRYQLSHRGLNLLANRAGMTMIPVPVSKSDNIKLDAFGEVDMSEIDIENPPTSEGEFRGICLAVKSLATGAIVTRQFLPKKIIDERRNGSDSYQYAEKNEWAKKSDPWHKWYVEMAMKTAMHYAIARGWCVINDAESQRAIAADVESDIAALPEPANNSVNRLDAIADVLTTTSTPEETPEQLESRLIADIATANVDQVNVICDMASEHNHTGKLSGDQYDRIAAAGGSRMKVLQAE